MYVLVSVLFLVCFFDYRHRKIPNSLIILLFLSGVIQSYLFARTAQSVVFYLLKCILVLIGTYPLFRIGTLGAGDSKLFAVSFAYLPLKEGILFLIVSFGIAAIFSILKIIIAQNGRERLYYLVSYVSEVIRSGQWSLYIQNEKSDKSATVCLSGPVFLSILLHMGNVY